MTTGQASNQLITSKKLLKIALILSASVLTPLAAGNIFATWKLKQLRADAYRPTDRYSIGKRYESNIRVTETTMFGDLCALSGAQNQQQCSFSHGPRTALFQTDGRGWKTLEKLDKSDYVIAGDSFLAALGGDSNKDQLGQQLKQITGKTFYEAAHPGDPGDYLQRILELDAEHPRGKNYIILIFEGNDLAQKSKSFPLAINPRPSDEHPWLARTRQELDRLIAKFKNPPLAKLLSIYLESYRLQRNRTTHVKADNSVVVNVNGKEQAFGVNNMQVSRDASLSLPISLSTEKLGFLKNKIKCIVFVPTKYSVYLSQRSAQERHPALFKDFSNLNSSGIATVDLTPALRAASQNRPKVSLWWSDDTHWNKEGIRVAANAIKEDPNCLTHTWPDPSEGLAKRIKM